MVFTLLRCFECCSQDLVEEYEGAPLTCKGCGVIGQVDKVPTADELILALDVCHVDKDFQLHQEMNKFAEKLAEKTDISELLGSLKIVRKKKRAPRYKPY